MFYNRAGSEGQEAAALTLGNKYITNSPVKVRKWSIMHEWALAEAVLEAVKENIKGENPKNVEKVTVLFGELQDVDPDIFQSGLENLTKDTPFQDTVFSIETEPALFRCNVCEKEWTLKSFPHLTEDERESIHFLPEAAHVYMQCPQCGSPDFLISKGRGVTVKSINILKS